MPLEVPRRGFLAPDCPGAFAYGRGDGCDTADAGARLRGRCQLGAGAAHGCHRSGEGASSRARAARLLRGRSQNSGCAEPQTRSASTFQFEEGKRDRTSGSVLIDAARPIC